MAVASLLKKIKVQDLGFSNHPCDTLDIDTKINYLKGISLIANEDDDISKNEIEYLNILVRSFHLSNEQVKGILKLAKNPSEEMIHDIIETFKSHEIKYNFIIDCLAIADIDGSFDEEEKDLIEQYEELFNISNKESDELYKMFIYLKDKDSQMLVQLFKQSEFFKQSDFAYLIDYYKIDVSSKFKRNDTKAFSFEFVKPTIRHGGLKNATEILIKPINNLQFSIFLNAMYNDNLIEFDNKNNIIASKNKKLLLSKENRTIQFKDSFFKPKKFTKKERIVYVTFNGALMFIDWLNTTFGTNYQLTELQVDKYNNLSLDDLNSYFVGNELFIKDNKYTKANKHELMNIINYSSVDFEYNSENSSFRLMK